MGLHGVSWTDVHRWSHAFIASVGNQSHDPDVFAASDVANAEADTALEESAAYLKDHPDGSMLSAMVHSDMPWDIARANAKLAISGGINEPEHVLTSGVHTFAEHPDVLDELRASPHRFADAFDELVRWRPPINMISREAKVDVEIGGVPIPAGSRVGALIGSANRDPEAFEDPDTFDIDRERRPHLSFGTGIHLCAGSWAARAAVAEIGWPTLYRELPGLRPLDPASVRYTGFVFRGLGELHVTW